MQKQARKCLFTVVIMITVVQLQMVNAQEVQKLNPLNSASAYIGCFGLHNTSLVSAHRGGPISGYPENALETLQKTRDYGPILLEVDIKETLDGHLVLMHDQTLDRTTNGSGYVTDFTLQELQSLYLTDNNGNQTEFRIPTLKSVLNWADEHAIVQLDIKRGIDFAKVAEAIVEADAIDSVLIIAYRVEDAIEALQVNENLSFAISVNRMSDLESIRAAGFSKSQFVAWTGVLETAMSCLHGQYWKS